MVPNGQYNFGVLTSFINEWMKMMRKKGKKKQQQQIEINVQKKKQEERRKTGPAQEYTQILFFLLERACDLVFRI